MTLLVKTLLLTGALGAAALAAPAPAGDTTAPHFRPATAQIASVDTVPSHVDLGKAPTTSATPPTATRRNRIGSTSDP